MKFLIPLGWAMAMVFAVALSSCQHDPALVLDDVTPTQDTVLTSTCSPDTAYFQTQVLPLLISRCGTSGCHDAAAHKEGINVTSYSSILSSRGGFVVKGNSSRSSMYTSLSAGGEDRMPPPPAEALSTEQKSLIRKWIDQGALNNACSNSGSNCNLTQVTFSATILPIINNKCKGCHSGGAPSGNIALTTYAQIRTQALNGKLYGSVANLAGYVAMPVGVKLPDCEIQQVKTWVDAGAPNN
jgi:hypothetical protein